MFFFFFFGNINTFIFFLKVKVKSLSRVRLFANPWTGSSVHGISQARILEWVAISFSSLHVLELASVSKNIVF